MQLTDKLKAAAAVLGWPTWEAYHNERWIRPCSNGSYEEIGLHAGSIYPDEAEDFDEATIAPVLADRWLAELRRRVEKAGLEPPTCGVFGYGPTSWGVEMNRPKGGESRIFGFGPTLLDAVADAAIQFGIWEAGR